MYIFYYKNIIYIYVCVCVCVCEFYIYKVIDCDTVAIVVADVRTPRQCVAALCGVFRETRTFSGKNRNGSIFEKGRESTKERREKVVVSYERRKEKETQAVRSSEKGGGEGGGKGNR